MKTLSLLLIFLFSQLPCFSQLAGDQKEALAEALYTEEVTRDPEAAAAQYEKIVMAHRQQRAPAAPILFRLAETRRAQGEDEAATARSPDILRFAPCHFDVRDLGGGISCGGGCF
jgi:hypothetical protein